MHGHEVDDAPSDFSLSWGMLDALEAWQQPVSSLLALAVAALASIHVVLHKRDARSAVGWVGLIWLVPLVGAVLYLLLGINRIRRRAVSLRQGAPRYNETGSAPPLDPALAARLGPTARELCFAIGRVTERPLLPGNCIEPLLDGDQAYPAMLEAIEGASRSISFCTYIFETRGVGARFVDALARAQERGVAVRVLIDDVGARYAAPRAHRVLRRRSVRTALFMPALWSAPYLNLRNHRKILVVDGEIGFTGGINIRAGHVLSDQPSHPVRDMHFRIRGPVVAQLQEVFAEDWEFTTRERLEGEPWFPPLLPAGDALARGIADGPDENFDKFTWTLHAALACARRSVTIVTPYFLPDASLTTALKTTALRGVDVQIVLPARGNLRLVEWAMWRQLEEVLGHGVRVWLTAPPFDHSKLMLVDGEWGLVGSANWDARSLRLNFELDVECYDRGLVALLSAQVEAKQKTARELLQEHLLTRPWPARVRDGFVRLLMPYL